jgi:hypothetical protein
MFNCERCGSSFSPIRVAGSENCPRCRAREGIASPLVFKVFESDSLPRPTEMTKADSARASSPVASSD